MQFLGDEEYSNTRIFDRRKSEYEVISENFTLDIFLHFL